MKREYIIASELTDSRHCERSEAIHMYENRWIATSLRSSQ